MNVSVSRRALRASMTITVVSASCLATSSALARELSDPATDFRIEAAERGPACVLAPAEQYDQAACAAITPFRPEDLAARLTDGVALVGAMVVKAEDFVYTVDVLREARLTTPAIRSEDVQDIAIGFAAKMQPSLTRSGVTARHEGLANLTHVGGVQVVAFELRADGFQGSPASALDCTEVALVLADGFTYTVEVRGPSSHAVDLREVAAASLATLRATRPTPSALYRTSLTAMRVAAVVFLAAVLALVVAWRIRRQPRAT